MTDQTFDHLYEGVLPVPYQHGQSVRSKAAFEKWASRRSVIDAAADFVTYRRRPARSHVRAAQVVIACAGGDAGPPPEARRDRVVRPEEE